MSTVVLAAHIIFATVVHYAGEEQDDTTPLYTSLVAAGAKFYPKSDPTIAAGSALCAKLRKRGLNETETDEVMMSFVEAYIAASAAGGVQPSRSIATTAPLAGGGDLSANRTLTIAPATALLPGSMSAADKAKLDTVQAGTDVLVAGVSAAIAANITASSRILVTRKDSGASVTIGVLAALSADRVVGAPGSFKVTSQTAANATEANDVSTFDWEVIG